ncbi:MAG: DeoR family transcriptional regulator [Christensenellaceae bacterium]
MKATERRQAILEALCERRQDKIENLAFEFDVTERTIRNDVLELSLTYPIYTVAGRYNSGVFIADDYYLGKQYLTPEQQELLEQLKSVCDVNDQKILQSIIKKFGKR